MQPRAQLHMLLPDTWTLTLLFCYNSMPATLKAIPPLQGRRASALAPSAAAPPAGAPAATLRASHAASRQKGTCENAARPARPPARSVSRIDAGRAAGCPAVGAASSTACARARACL